MAQRLFLTAQQAREYARRIAIEHGASTTINALGDKWLVEGQHVKDDTALYVEIENALRSELLASDEVIELISRVDAAIKQLDFSSISELDLTNEVRDFLIKLPDTLELLHRFWDALADVGKVRSKEHAEEMAYEFNSIATSLNGYKVSVVARRKEKEMIGSNFVSERLAKHQAGVLQIISRLEAAKGKCKCGGKWVVKGQASNYFWGCNEYPKCVIRQNLTNAERDLFP
jgi:hypothetical protein